MTAIQCSGLTRAFAGITAVDDLTMSVPEGSVYGLLGPNGAGKSTTVQLIVGTIAPDTGAISVFGSDPTVDPVTARNHIGYLPDDFSPFKRLSGREHLEYVADAYNSDENLSKILSVVGLEEAADRRATGYSSGMQQRLGLAMAIVGAPDLLILDEPFANLDPQGVDVVRGVIEVEVDRGATVLISTHQLEAVENEVDHVGFISKGSLAASGHIEELRREADLQETNPSLRELYYSLMNLEEASGKAEPMQATN
jgi:ABC-2 type transport system ATP-binding protein